MCVIFKNHLSAITTRHQVVIRSHILMSQLNAHGMPVS